MVDDTAPEETKQSLAEFIEENKKIADAVFKELAEQVKQAKQWMMGKLTEKSYQNLVLGEWPGEHLFENHKQDQQEPVPVMQTAAKSTTVVAPTKNQAYVAVKAANPVMKSFKYDEMPSWFNGDPVQSIGNSTSFGSLPINGYPGKSYSYSASNVSSNDLEFYRKIMPKMEVIQERASGSAIDYVLKTVPKFGGWTTFHF